MPCEATTRKTDASLDPDGMTWRVGHIIEIRPVGTPWSARLLDRCYVFDIVDADVDQASAVLLQSHKTEFDDFQDFIRAYRIRFEELPPAVRQQVESEGRADVTMEMLRQASRHALTRERW